jgi:hypothetical protein
VATGAAVALCGLIFLIVTRRTEDRSALATA